MRSVQRYGWTRFHRIQVVGDDPICTSRCFNRADQSCDCFRTSGIGGARGRTVLGFFGDSPKFDSCLLYTCNPGNFHKKIYCFFKGTATRRHHHLGCASRDRSRCYLRTHIRAIIHLFLSNSISIFFRRCNSLSTVGCSKKNTIPPQLVSRFLLHTWMGREDDTLAQWKWFALMSCHFDSARRSTRSKLISHFDLCRISC